MLTTPHSFTPLIAPQEHAAPYTFIFRGNELLIRESDLSLPDAAACAAMRLQNAHIHPVGMLGERYCRAAWVDKDAAPADGHTFKNLRALFGAMDEQLLSVAGRAFQLMEWARTHRYCGACATAMTLVKGERCFKCPACNSLNYPRISPAMMVLIKKGDTILLARHTASPTNRFSPLAGFLEAGESIEDAVHREVFEEVGLKIDRLKYFGSQSWPFPHSLMIAFTAEYVSGEITVDRNEIAEAHWFGPGDRLPEYTTGVSISGALIEAHLPSRKRD